MSNSWTIVNDSEIAECSKKVAELKQIDKLSM